jgi:glycosyltransferase involved in cell wall biosynthesis
MPEIISGLVSTIIPVYNRPSLVGEAVASVLAQTYRPIELIIVDDGSTDITARVTDELARKYPEEIRVIHQPNRGPGLAREAGRLVAKGEFIQYLDSDDLLLPKKFELQVAGLTGNPDCGVSYGKTRYYLLGENPVDIPWKRTGEKIDTMFPAFLQSRWWGTSTALYRREVCDRAGPWSDLWHEEDWEYDCRIASQGIRLHYCDEFISNQREHDGHRLSRESSRIVELLRHRSTAHGLIYQHARKAGINETVPEMQHFARELFLLARQCGAAGLDSEARTLFDLSRAASGSTRAQGWDFRFYRLLAGIFGWARMGRFACFADRFRVAK